MGLSRPARGRDDPVPVGVGVVPERHVEPVAQLDEARHRVRRGGVHPDPAVPVAGHEREPRVDRGVRDRQVEAVALADPRPVGHARAAERVGAEAQAGRPDRIHVDDRREVVDVGRHVVMGRDRRAGVGRRHLPDAIEAGLQEPVRLVLDPAGDVRVGRAAVGRVVLEAAVLGRVVRRRHDDAVGQAIVAAAVVDEDRVRDDRGRRVAVVGIDPDVDTVRDERPAGPSRRPARTARACPFR